MARAKDNGGFFCLAHRERVSMSWFDPGLGVAAIALRPFLIPEDLAGALTKRHSRAYDDRYRLARARVLRGLRVAQAFRDRHKDCEVEAANFASPGFTTQRVSRAAERAGLTADPSTFWVRSFMADTPAPFSEADAQEATKASAARLAKLREETKARERRLATERIPVMERGLVENQVREARALISVIEADLAEPLPPAPTAELEALMKSLAEDPLAEDIDAEP